MPMVCEEKGYESGSLDEIHLKETLITGLR